MKTIGKYRDLISSYSERISLLRTRTSKVWFAVLLVLLIATPWLGIALFGNYATYLLNLTIITIIVALGLNFLMGVTGLVSLGHAAFFAIGAYTAGFLANQWNFSVLLTLPAAACVAAIAGFVVGLPALRLKGHYLILATLAFQFVTDFSILRLEPITGGANGLAVPAANIAGIEFQSDLRFYFLALFVAIMLSFGMANLMRSKIGRAAVAIRESDVAAEAVGVNLARYKTMSFAVSAAYAGIAGCLYAHYLGYIGPDHFTVMLSIEYVVMVVVGGSGSILGAILGAAFITLLPEILREFEGALLAIYPNFIFPDLRVLVVGASIILFLLFEPKGLAGLYRRLKDFWNTWPFSH